MSTVRRYDATQLRPAKKTKFGFVKADARLTRVGVLEYRLANGSTRRELRHPDEVFNPDSIASLEMAPLTLGHPTVAVTPENAKEHTVGSVGEPKQDGRFVRASVMVTDAKAIAVVEGGTNQVSCGYDCRLDETPGVYNDEPYDAVQRDIVYNHVAVGVIGRAGPEVSIRLDGTDAVSTDLHRVDDGAHDKDTSMKKLNIDGIDCELPEQSAQLVQAKMTKDAEQIATLKKDAEKLQAKVDSLTEELKKLKTDAAPENFTKAVRERVILEATALKVLGGDMKCDGLSDLEVKKAVIVKLQPSAKFDGKSDEYINARYDAAIESIATKSATDVRGAAHDAALSNADEAKTAHEAMVKRNRDAWKTKAA